MRFYWVRDIIQQNNFYIFWEEGKKNLTYYIINHHPISHHRTMRQIYLKATKKDMEILKERQTGTGRGCDGTINPRVTWKPANTLKEIRDPIA